MTTRTRHLIKEEEAVSPVIGVILMVAITVILAAVIGAFVFGMGGSLKKTYSVAVTATQSDAGVVDITFQGGPDADLVKYLNVSVGSSTYFGAVLTTVSPTTTAADGTFGVNPAVGKMVSITDTTVTSGRDHIIVTAEFADGTQQVVLDTYV